jgi:hypothetical protein
MVISTTEKFHSLKTTIGGMAHPIQNISGFFSNLGGIVENSQSKV